MHASAGVPGPGPIGGDNPLYHRHRTELGGCLRRTGLAIAMLSKGKGFGNWLRLLGRHHTRAHWTRVYDLEQGAWLDSTQAIKYILGYRPDCCENML